ncbi:hypothetical protein BJ138DRAFT_1083215 [Hygrophoropsis aurantiaca]|uniref:Uncharacterized protein n=1 Tax=Hygrophoropsis aurantiaca TaxID=72124 RepID=A0ACB8AI88_9AGAM|nr:hypothetical protein BJ138DRAFT_1083215 [Hygrophoropsis aurantiaca]
MSSTMTSSSTRVSTVFGNWRRVSNSPADIDLEAQIITGTHAPFSIPAAPEPAYSAAAPIRTPDNSDTTNPIDDFFGVTRARATRESRHDSYPSVSRSAAFDAEAPPPYADATDLPAYESTPAEPVTLAMYLFKFGFLFPLFWVLGAIILVSPLTAPADFEPSKSEAERMELVQVMRDAEMKWAKRSAWALLILLLVVGAITGAAVGIMKS